MQPDGQDQDLLSLYQSIILDHGKSPRNTGRVERHDCSSEGRNPLCGDRVTVTAALDESDVLTDLKFDAKGCAISIASASMMTEAAKGLTTDEVQRISDAVRILCIEKFSSEAINGFLGETLSARLESLRALSGVRQFPTRAKCALLPWQTLMACIQGNSTASTER